MIATSTVVMLPLMNLNTYAADHVFFSETRTYMAPVMGAAMALIMLAFTLRMLTNPRCNALVVVAAIAVDCNIETQQREIAEMRR